VDYLIAYKVLLTASHICFHQKSTTLAYVLEVTVMRSPYAQITFVNPVYPQMLILFPLIMIISVFYYCIYYNVCVCYLSHSRNTDVHARSKTIQCT